jgi:hypothetical protein
MGKRNGGQPRKKRKVNGQSQTGALAANLGTMQKWTDVAMMWR